MVEFIGYGIGGIGVVSSVFMWGHTVATRSKLESMIKKDDCIKYRESLDKRLGSYRNIVDNKLGEIHEKINTVAVDVAEIKGFIKKNDKPKQ